tara:strand:- start:34010 stop:34333 length:324 start_codon:yes stop_codon:yes gene_type:complete
MVDVNSEKFKACVKIVISQTDYDEEKATEKLIEFNEDFIKVIKQYLNPDFDKKKPEPTIKKNQMNQEIIKQIRNFKDKQDSNYLSRKENVEKMKKLYELHLSKKNEA